MAAAMEMACCSLAGDRNDENYTSLKDLLLQNVWSYFTCKRSQEATSPNGHDENNDDAFADELPALLISAGISGCTAAMDFILDVARKKTSEDISIEKAINVRVPCHFPIPDTWIHKTVYLAVSPLHMACWRLDIVMIHKLLSLGADPNLVALEGHAIKGDDPVSNNAEEEIGEGGSRWVSRHGLRFDPTSGFSPLHFIALGLRSPPRNSLTEGQKQRVIHDICVSYNETILSLKSDNDELSYALKSARELYPFPTLEENDTKSEIVEGCIKTLLSVGANPNSGRAVYLCHRFPIDVIIQPPIGIYYASSMARSTQTSESLSRQNFEFNLRHITAAIRTLLHEGARLSPRFLSNHAWNLHMFDCFYVRMPTDALSFVEFLFFLGAFPNGGNNENQIQYSVSPENTYRHTASEYDIKKFIAAVNNISVAEALVDLLLKWFSLPILRELIQGGKEILARTRFSLPNISQLVDMATREQLRPLKHLCKLVIVGAVGFDINRIQSLPLPSPLKRDLRVIRY